MRDALRTLAMMVELLSAMILFGYFAGSLMKVQNPFAEFRLPTQHIVGKPPAPHSAPKQTHVHAASQRGACKINEEPKSVLRCLRN